MASKANARKNQKCQAILLADSFITTHRFRPMTKHTPKVLLPLVNVPMLEYSLEFLSSCSQIDEIVIFCASHSDKIQEYINSTRWLHKQPDLKVKVIVNNESKSVGHALRYLDSLGDVVRDDFLLLTADVVSNIDLGPIITKHRQTAAKDTTDNFVLTMVFTTIPPGHAMRSRTDDLTLAVDRATGQILEYYDNIQGGEFELSDAIIKKHGQNGIDIHYNAFDTGIMMCRRRLLNVFTDNFDHQELREHYIQQQLHPNADVAAVVDADTIYSHFVTKGAYATRIVDMRTYHTCSHDIIRKWVAPLVISNNILGKTSYRNFPNNIYREENVSLAHTTLLKADCVLGANSTIGASTVLHKTIIGRNVAIGQHTSLTTCYVLDNAQIGNGCVINGAFIGTNVKIGNNVTIHKGAVIDSNVILADGIIVPPYISITADEELAQEETTALLIESLRIQQLQAAGNWVNINDPNNYYTNDQGLTLLKPEVIQQLDLYPTDTATAFYNDEPASLLADRLQALAAGQVSVILHNSELSQIDGDLFEPMDQSEAEQKPPRILLPSLNVLQSDCSPHQVFGSQSMCEIMHPTCVEDDGYTNNDLGFDDLSLPLQPRSQRKLPRQALYNQRDTDQNFAPYTNKSYEALLKNTRFQTPPETPKQSLTPTTMTPSTSGHDLFMLSPSTLQQTLTSNSMETNRALSQKLPFHPLADLHALNRLPQPVIVGHGGVGRVYLHPPHHDYGRAIVLLNSLAPPAYLNLQNYPAFNQSAVLHGDQDDDDEEEDEDDDDYSDHHHHHGFDNTNIEMADNTPAAQPQRIDNLNPEVVANEATFDTIRSFCVEVAQAIFRSKAGERIDNIIQELPTFRFTYRIIGFDAHCVACFLALFGLAGYPHPDRGIFRGFEQSNAESALWEEPSTPVPDRVAMVKLIASCKAWIKVFNMSDNDIVQILFPSLLCAALLHEKYAPAFAAVLNAFWEADLFTAEQLTEFYETIRNGKTIGAASTGRSLLPLIIEMTPDNQNILGLAKLLPTLARIVDSIQDDDEDEDEDDDEDE